MLDAIIQRDARREIVRVKVPNDPSKVDKGELRVNVKDHGAVGDGTTDDTTAVTAAVAEAIATKRELWFPDSTGSYLVEAPILVSGATDFRIDMEGRLKRKNASVRNSLLYFLNCTGVRAKTIRTDGNAVNNTFVQSDAVAYMVDEAKHDVRVDGCTDVEIGLLDSRNPAGDTIYVVGATSRFSFGTVNSYSEQSSGRNAVSLIDCADGNIGRVRSIGTGCKDGVIAMPGGFDIEPNSGQQVSDVTVGEILVETSGTCGFAMFGNYTGSGSLGAGVKQIRHITVGDVVIHKTAGVKTNASDMPFKGCDDVSVGSIRHTTDAANTNQAMAIDDCNDIRLTVEIPRNGSTPINIGASAVVDRLDLRGRIGASGSHCIQIYALTNSRIDMRLKNPPNGFMLISKNATGASSNVVFSGDWRKDSTGSWAMNIAAAVTDWRLDGVDMTGWPGGGRMMPGANAQTVERFNVKGLTYGTAAPTTDWWGVGQYVENTNPGELGAAGSKYVVRGWICTAAGNPGTWLQVRTLTGN